MTSRSKENGLVGFLFLVFVAILAYWGYKHINSSTLEVIWTKDSCVTTIGPNHQMITGTQKIEKVSSDEWKFTCALDDGRSTSAVILTSQSLATPATYTATSTLAATASSTPKTLENAKIVITNTPDVRTTLTADIPSDVNWSSLLPASFLKKLESLTAPKASAKK